MLEIEKTITEKTLIKTKKVKAKRKHIHFGIKVIYFFFF